MVLNTRQDFVRLASSMLTPLIPMYSPGKARLSLGKTGATYSKDVIELEAFSRPLWALSSIWAGNADGAERCDSDAFRLIYINGLAHGTDPAHSEYWGGFLDYDQRFVEMPAIAFALLTVPDVIWDAQPEERKSDIAAWLYGINDYYIPLCNWQFFRVIVNLALKKLGMPYSKEKIAESLDEIDSYYLGEGWYRDGQSSQKDYYISFGMHYYGLLYSVFATGEDEERRALFRARAKLFAGDFIYWFSDEGPAIPFGRSLTYRFAQAAFWSACVFAGIEPYPLPVMKGIITRHLDYWTRQAIFDRDGILNIGYTYPNLSMAERYNAPGSPYWAMKSFIFLALPETHPFFATKAEPMPRLDTVKSQPRADMILHRLKNETTAYVGGVCELFGHGHLIEKYSKFAYSTAFGFSIAHSSYVLHEACPDSMLAFMLEDGIVRVRKNSAFHELRGGAVYSEWSPCFGIDVKTWITPIKNGHIRRHEIESKVECVAIDFGFAVPGAVTPGTVAPGLTPSLVTSHGEVSSNPVAVGDTHLCKVRFLEPGIPGKHVFLIANPNTNVLFTNTVIPGIQYSISRNKSVLITEVTTDVRQ